MRCAGTYPGPQHVTHVLPLDPPRPTGTVGPDVPPRSTRTWRPVYSVLFFLFVWVFRGSATVPPKHTQGAVRGGRDDRQPAARQTRGPACALTSPAFCLRAACALPVRCRADPGPWVPGPGHQWCLRFSPVRGMTPQHPCGCVEQRPAREARRMASVCCEYKVARRGMLVTNMISVLFAFIFIGVVRKRERTAHSRAALPARPVTLRARVHPCAGCGRAHGRALRCAVCAGSLELCAATCGASTDAAPCLSAGLDLSLLWQVISELPLGVLHFKVLGDAVAPARGMLMR